MTRQTIPTIVPKMRARGITGPGANFDAFHADQKAATATSPSAALTATLLLGSDSEPKNPPRKAKNGVAKNIIASVQCPRVLPLPQDQQ